MVIVEGCGDEECGGGAVVRVKGGERKMKRRQMKMKKQTVSSSFEGKKETNHEHIAWS